MAASAASCSVSSVIVSRAALAAQVAGPKSPALAAWATVPVWALFNRKVGWAVKTICADGRPQRVAKLAKSPVSAWPLTRAIGCRFDRFDQAVQAARAGLKAFAFQFGHHRLNLVQAEFAIFNLARQFRRELKHRVEQRRFFGLACRSCKRWNRAAISLILTRHSLGARFAGFLPWPCHGLPAQTNRSGRHGKGRIIAAPKCAKMPRADGLRGQKSSAQRAGGGGRCGGRGGIEAPLGTIQLPPTHSTASSPR
jgi:hypothetical protein